jgi:NAD(P)-dependent dehydrogenase (short-subunit alcohol dehydrogenase family)
VPPIPITPSFRLDGRRALVTGAGRGIGFAIAAALAEYGADVVLAARGTADLNEASEVIRGRGGLAEPVALDVSNIQAVRQFVEAQPSFQILVNGAGTNRPKALPATTVEDFDAIFDLNIRAAYFICQSVASRLISEGQPGSIINISSQMGHVGAENRSVYCASKHAVEGLTKALAVELASHKIRVNAIAPTFIETPMTAPFLQDPAFRARVQEKIKLGRLGRVEDVMGAAVFLASDASALVTGASILVDGGWTAE